MTIEELVKVILSVSMMTADEARQAIDRPIEAAGIDSLDLELLRTSIEKHLQREISETVWQDSRSLRELLDAL